MGAAGRGATSRGGSLGAGGTSGSAGDAWPVTEKQPFEIFFVRLEMNEHDAGGLRADWTNDVVFQPAGTVTMALPSTHPQRRGRPSDEVPEEPGSFALPAQLEAVADGRCGWHRSSRRTTVPRSSTTRSAGTAVRRRPANAYRESRSCRSRRSVAQQFEHCDPSGRIEAVGRLVEQQQLWIVYQGGGQLKRCRLPVEYSSSRR